MRMTAGMRYAHDCRKFIVLPWKQIGASWCTVAGCVVVSARPDVRKSAAYCVTAAALHGMMCSERTSGCWDRQQQLLLLCLLSMPTLLLLC
jgi:hypothetical protein